jgi:hypothetical protein
MILRRQSSLETSEVPFRPGATFCAIASALTSYHFLAATHPLPD